MAWMAWTTPSAVFFLLIAALLVTMTIGELVSPTTERKGVLPMRTPRGDRLFLGLVMMAFIHLAWLGLIGADKLWWVLTGSITWLLIVLRWG